MYLISLLGVAACVFTDQFTKYLAAAHLKNSPLVLIDGVFELRYLENGGASFGILQNKQWLFLILTVILLAFIIRVYFILPRTKRALPLRVCLVLICGGAAGNMIDRIRHGYVVDFLYFKLINFPIFNVADMFITTAALVTAALLLFYYRDDELNITVRGIFRLSDKKKDK